MLLWGLYLSLFWAISLYSISQDIRKPERLLSSIENLMTSVVITLSVLGLFHAPLAQVFAPYLIILLPLSAFFEISNAVTDLKSDRIKEQLQEDIPQDILNKIAFYVLSATLLPGYLAGAYILIKFGGF
tara:strand:+ start:170670 stop:171056 length:387 start_codon:yes stop_codon:yes gene_type:complete